MPRFPTHMGLACSLAGIFLSAGLLGCPSSVEPPEGLDFPGPYTVSQMLPVIEDSWEYPLSPSVFYPDAARPREEYPVVFFCTGWNQMRSSYDGIASQLAEHGYVVFIAYFPSFGIWDIGFDFFEEHVEQVDVLVNWCAAQNASPDSPLYRKCDLARLGMAGHSMGGHIAIVKAIADPRVKAVVSLDALIDRPTLETVGDLDALRAPILYIGAADGSICSYFDFSLTDPAILLYDFSNPPKQEVMITGADHLDFIDYRLGEPVLDQEICAEGTADASLVRKIASRYMISWFNYYIKGETEFLAYFNGPSSERDERGDLVTIRRELQ